MLSMVANEYLPMCPVFFFYKAYVPENLVKISQDDECNFQSMVNAIKQGTWIYNSHSA